MSAPTIPQLFFSHWTLAPTICAGSGVVAVAYLIAAQRAERWPPLRTLAFLGGVFAILVALDSGLDAFDDDLLSVHMAQHILLIDIGPPLLLCGRPAELILRILPPRPRRSFGRGLVGARRYATAPVCVILYSILILGWHTPPAFDAAVTNQTLHNAEHACFVIAGLLLWWPLVGDPVPSRRLGALGQLIYLAVAMMPMTIIGAYLDRRLTPLYSVYVAPAHALHVSAVADQQQAGAIMWVIGTTLMAWAGLMSVLAAMRAAERRQQARDLQAARLREVGR